MTRSGRRTKHVQRFAASTYRRGIIHVKMGLLDALTMISLRIGQAKQAFFQNITKFSRSAWPSVELSTVDLLFLVPKCKCNVLQAMRIGDTGDAIFTPTKGPRPRMVVWEVFFTPISESTLGP